LPLGRYEALVAHRPLAYAETHRLTGFLAASLQAGRSDAAIAALTCLQENTERQDSIPYLSGVLLCVAAVLCLNTKKVSSFTRALALLHATLDRTPSGGTSELAQMHLLKSKLPPPPEEFTAERTIFDQLTIDDRAKIYESDPAPGWKSRMLQEALDAQLGIWQRRNKGLAPSADELLRILTLRGGAVPECRDHTVWLMSELRAIYQPHLPPCDEMGVSFLWLLLLQACTSPRTPSGDAACERAVAWLGSRGADYAPLREHFETLHSSAQQVGAQYAWAATGVKNKDNDSDSWWHTPLATYLYNLKRIYPEKEQQRRAFTVMLEACCLWLMLGQPTDVPGSETSRDAIDVAANEGGYATQQRWAVLCMLGALLAEYRELWTLKQHAATARLLSSLVFVYRDPKTALKLRANMQYLVTDPPPNEISKLSFLHNLTGNPQQFGRRAVGVAAEIAQVYATGRFPDHFHLQLVAENEWTEILTALVLKLQPLSTDMGGFKTLAERLAAVTITTPALPGLPARSHQPTVSDTAAQKMATKLALPPRLPGGDSGGATAGMQEVMAPPEIPGVTRMNRGESISALLPPPPPLPALPGMGGVGSEGYASPAVRSPPQLPGMSGFGGVSPPPVLPQLPGRVVHAAAPPPPTLPGGGVAPPAGHRDSTMPPQLPGAVGGVHVPLPPVLGARGSAPPPPSLLAGRAPQGSIAPPPPMLATARRSTTTGEPPQLAQEKSDLGWSDDEGDLRSSKPPIVRDERGSFSQTGAKVREEI